MVEKKSPIYLIVHIISFPSLAIKRHSLKSESETSKKKRLLADSLLLRGPEQLHYKEITYGQNYIVAVTLNLHRLP